MSAIAREIINAFRFEVQSNAELTNSYEYLRAENQKLQLRIAELESQLSDSGSAKSSGEEKLDPISTAWANRNQVFHANDFSVPLDNQTTILGQSTPAIRWDEKTKTIRQVHDDNSPVYFPEV